MKQREVLYPLLFNLTVEYTIRTVQVNQISLTVNGTHQFLVYAEDVHVMAGSLHTVEKKKAYSLVVASKKTGLEGNADSTKFMVMSRDLEAGRSHNIKIVWKSSNIWE